MGGMSAWFQRLGTMLLVLASLSGLAEPKPGVDFDYLAKPIPIASPGKVEVIEFFWYGCPHCYHAEAPVEFWAGSLPKDVVFRREHAMFEGNSNWLGHAKLFVALRIMGLVDKLTPAVFDAIHKEGLELRNEDVLFPWIAKQGVDRTKFETAYSSFQAQALLAQSMRISDQYGLTGVPAFIVNGKYRVSPSHFQTIEQFFAVLNTLIAHERDALSAAAPTKDEAAPVANSKKKKK